MRPIPQTVEIAAQLNEHDDDVDLLAHLQALADQVQRVVPDCMGLSIAWTDRGLAFTLVSSDEEIAVLDAVQFLTGGPCVDTVGTGTGLHWSESDPLDEERWREFARATAAKSVRSTLTLPLVTAGCVMGSANLYAASDHAFEGHLDVLADILGGSAAGVVRNADLSFSTRAVAEAAPDVLRSEDGFDEAVGLLVDVLGVSPEEAARRLLTAATQVELPPTTLATALVLLLGR